MISLNWENWMIWRSRMRDLMYYHDLFDPNEGSKPEEISDDEWKRLDRKAVSYIRQHIDESIYHLCLG